MRAVSLGWNRRPKNRRIGRIETGTPKGVGRIYQQTFVHTRTARILTDSGSKYCGNRETHEYVLYVDLESIQHTRTKTKHPQTNGICERIPAKTLSINW